MQFAADVIDNVLAVPYAVLQRGTTTADDSDAVNLHCGVIGKMVVIASNSPTITVDSGFTR